MLDIERNNAPGALIARVRYFNILSVSSKQHVTGYLGVLSPSSSPSSSCSFLLPLPLPLPRSTFPIYDDIDSSYLYVRLYTYIGDTAFVLVSSYNPTGKVEYHLWKPSTGEHFRQYDTLCPLQDVYFVFNDTNVSRFG